MCSVRCVWVCSVRCVWQCEVFMSVRCAYLYALTTFKVFQCTNLAHLWYKGVSWFEPVASLSLGIYMYMCLPIDIRMATKF